MKLREIVRWVILLVVGGFFVVAGGGKVADPHAFAASITNYQLVSGWPAFAAALWLPWLEVLAGLGLLIAWSRRDSIYLLLGMLIIFELALASAWARGLDINCGCLGAIDATSVAGAFARNLVLIAGLVYLLKEKNS